MDINHVEASLCFPTFPRFCGQTFTEAKDQELGAGLREGLQRLDGRGVVRRLRRPLIPLPSSRCGTPSWPPPRCGATPTGACAPCFSEIPPHLGLPSIHSGDWDPFFAACEDRHVINMHIGSSSTMPATSPDAPVGGRRPR